ncbi:hypothetical protein Vadar_006243 [Vaccinium darrowii]|uniref:Uncharacterized protein n=1 Tax=Vaccinium darrowii TaxID=229202 RepID=A0ACB7YLP7_9ERIC|nr:hypothetical protein Vadar_006243 [Vaccinium darrowii]
MDVTEIGKKLGLSESKQVICKAAELHRLCDIQFDCSAIGIGETCKAVICLEIAATRTIQVRGSRIVIIEGMYALSERLRPLLDLHVSVTGGVHFDLVKRVLRDIQRAGQEPKEIIHQMPQVGFINFIPPCF